MTAAPPITDEELPTLFAGFERWPLALAVSGGADSMALMHMVARWAAREDVRAAWAERTAEFFAPRRDHDHWWSPIGASGQPVPSWLGDVSSAEDLRRVGGPPHVVVLTVDHGLRPEAAEEAAFVAREAAKLGLPCQILRWEGEKPATGIQNAAREARRRLLVEAIHAEADCFAGILQPHGLRLWCSTRTLVLAHHQEDQAETVLMRLARGSGLEGLRGMRSLDFIRIPADELRPLAIEVQVLRPLLGVPKARLVALLQANGAHWIDDPSNEDERFERVRIRRVLRQLEPLGFTAEKIALSARRLADAEMSLVRLLDGSDSLERPSPLLAMFADIDLMRPDFASRYTASRYLRRVFAAYGGAARAAELAQIEEFAGRTTRPGSRSRLGAVTLGGCKLEPHGEGNCLLRVYREGSGEGLPIVSIQPGQAVDWDGGRFRVSAESWVASGACVRALGMAGWAELKRKVPELADLKWPAAAAATLPVISREGAIVAYPVIDDLLRTVQSLPARPRTSWSTFAATLEPGFKASFNIVPW